MEQLFFKNDVLEATLWEDGWVFVLWLNNRIGYLSKSFIKTMKFIEQQIQERKLTGWICNSEKEHTTMHGIIRKFGGTEFTESPGLLWFKKEMNHV